jgi:UDP-N-acetylmuramoylalanine--D-glutamate ligase
MTTFKDKNIAIIGLGTEGIAVAKFLGDNFSTLTLLDRLSEEKIIGNCPEGEKAFLKELLSRDNVKKVFSNQYLDDLKSFDVVFRSPGLSFFNQKIQEAKKNGVEITSQIKLFLDLCPAKIIGVTGTKGKGTTASLIYEILKNQKKHAVYLAGNIGYSALDLLEKIKPEDIVILELSSFQLMDLGKSPHIAVVTNLTIDHLDYHENEEEYRSAKFNVLTHQNKNDVAILNSGSTFSAEQLKDIESKIEYFGNNKETDQCVVENNAVILDLKGERTSICKLSGIKLLGRHNLENIAAATLVAKKLKIDNQTIIETVEQFKGLPHRLEFVRELDGVKYINDSFATNPGPTIAAIKSFEENNIVLILGGSSKGANFTELAETIKNNKVSAVVAMGDEALNIEHALEKAGYKGMFWEIYDLRLALNLARREAKAGDYVILSPACASFDMFKNYKDRGEKFKSMVFDLS